MPQLVTFQNGACRNPIPLNMLSVYISALRGHILHPILCALFFAPSHFALYTVCPVFCVSKLSVSTLEVLICIPTYSAPHIKRFILRTPTLRSS